MRDSPEKRGLALHPIMRSTLSLLPHAFIVAVVQLVPTAVAQNSASVRGEIGVLISTHVRGDIQAIIGRIDVPDSRGPRVLITGLNCSDFTMPADTRGRGSLPDAPIPRLRVRLRRSARPPRAMTKKCKDD